MTNVTLSEQPSAVPQLIGAVGSSPRVNLPSITVTRPNNVTQYAIGDVFGPAGDGRIQLPNAARANGGLVTVTAWLQLNSAQATKPQFEFWWFNAQPSVAIGDNAPLTGLSDADIAAIVSRGSFTAWNAVQPQAGKLHSLTRQTIGGTCYTLPASRDLWFYIAMLNAYTPVANEALKLRFQVQYDS